VTLSDRLADLKGLPNSETVAETRRATAPTGWEVGVKYEPDGTRLVTSGAVEEADDPDGVLAAMGVCIPDGMVAKLVEIRHDPYAWTRENHGDDAVTRPVVRYKWVIIPVASAVPIEDLLEAVSRRKPGKVSAPSTDVAAIVAGYETQWGKIDQGGSEQILANVFASHDASISRFRELKKQGKVGTVALAIVGDCLENGSISQHGNIAAAGRMDLTLTEQLRVYRRTLAAMVMDWLDVTEQLTIAVVGGNHDQAERRGQIERNVRDSWALEGAASVADVMEAAGHGDRISWIMPKPDEVTVTFTIAGTQVGLIHGHQTRGKMREYVAHHALARDPFGGSDIILSGHYHSLKVDQIGPSTVHIQTPALEGGSDWYRHSTGISSPRGNVMFLTKDGAWNGLEVV